jgi:predicted MPP superfamily phosphohydrolase
MKTNKFSWLHLSDLHIGQKSQWLWPNFKAIFLEDLRRLSIEAGPIDLVVFSGDLTQCGEKSQYESLTHELKTIWEVLDKLGQTPLLFTVPGNHDLERPPSNNARMRMLTRWDSEPDIVREFWEEKDNQYVDLVRSVFANYMAWQENISNQGIEFAPIQKGIMPGDASSSIVLNGISVGLIGLNSSFLQLDNSKFNDRLALDLRQLNAITDGDAPRWCDKHNINFLITHHPASWLSVEARRQFQTEIYPSGRFTAHLYGHMHEADLTTQYHGGDSGRKSLQSSSLFGMEFLGDGKTARVHGYSIGQIYFDGDDVTWKLWPRISTVNRKSGVRKLIPDHDNFEIVPGHEFQTETFVKSPPSSKSVGIAPPRTFDLAVAVEESAPQWNNALHSAVYSLPDQEQHLAIRPLEQQACIESIRQKKMAWVCADWGLGRDGFIWSVIKRMQRDTQPVYRITLGNYSSRDEFLTNFATLTGCSFPEFCKALAAAGRAMLLLDEAPVSAGVCVGLAIERDAESLASMIRDFCQDIIILLLARTSPRDHKINVVTLEPLDEADTRAYLMAHPSAGTELKSSHAVSVIHRRTDGLPGKIDRTLKTLRVISLSELEPANLVEPVDTVETRESIPMSLVQAVAELSKSKDQTSKRSYLLLKVLTILPHGESLERLKRIDNQYPIFPKHAEELLDSDLIQVRSSTTLIGINRGDEDRIKVLFASRPVRDYVLSTMSNREIDSLVSKATTLYFGDQWRLGNASLRKLEGALTSDDGSLMENPHNIVMRLLKGSVTSDSSNDVPAILNLCQIYCRALLTGKHYRNCIAVCRDVLSIAPEVGFESQLNAINTLLVKCLRMSGEYSAARPLLEQLLTIKQQSKVSRAEILLEYALCLQSLKDPQAIIAAKEVIKLMPRTGHALQAQAIIIEMEDDADKGSKLLLIENEARKCKFNTVANNLALERVSDNEDYSILRIVHSTAVDSGDAYTASRAALRIGTLSFKESGTLLNNDLNNLINAYQYCYGERFSSLFSRTHEALWSYFKSRADVKNLLILYRHSSFIWRVHGDENKEQIYAQQLICSARQILATDILSADKNTAYFLIRANKEKFESDA